MKNASMFAAALCAAVPLSVQPASAQEATAPAEQDAHVALYDAMEAGVDQGQVMEITLDAIVGQMVQAQPEFSDIEEQKPGFFVAMKDALRGPMQRYSSRLQVEYRPRMIAVAREVFTAEEATALAAFYRSELGQRMLQSASGNFSVDNVLQATVAGQAPTEETVTADLNTTGQRVLAALSEEDQAAIFAAAITIPGFRKMPSFQQGIAPVRAEMEAAPPTEKENTAIMEAVVGVMQRYAN